ncbi:hypothetical protein HPB50_013495 [Hyalomma asiaticum]|uniref:Uncharacterized protein n=1 Tax=Hyalomma asiaticum TaxID=266040 RepID=A0ACB7S6T0_HYAAI|nr:hypothetical protein HPB50_013495 [Hyalomma asiaticum]
METRTSMGDDIKNMLCFEDDQLISPAVEHAVLEMTEEVSPGPSRGTPHCRQRRDAPDFFALSQFGGCVPAQGLEQRRLKPKDYCSLLDVPRNSSSEDIRRAYRQLALKWHPDKNPGNKAEAQARFKNISEAYEVLSDESKRLHYDLRSRGGRDTGHHADLARSRDDNANTNGGAFPFAYRDADALFREFFGSSDTFQDLFCGAYGGQCGPVVVTGGFEAYQQNFGSAVRAEFFIDLENLLFAPHLPASAVSGSSAGLVPTPTQQVSSLGNNNGKRMETRISIRDDIKNMLCFEDGQLISPAVERAVF